MTCVVMRVIACRPGLALHSGSYSCAFEFGCAVCVGWFLQQQKLANFIFKFHIIGQGSKQKEVPSEGSLPRPPFRSVNGSGGSLKITT